LPEKLNSLAVSALRRAVADVKLIGHWIPPCFGRLSRWSQLYLQSLVPNNPHWARVVVYGPFSLRRHNMFSFSPISSIIWQSSLIIHKKHYKRIKWQVHTADELLLSAPTNGSHAVADDNTYV
jgi:hypothetical protein